MKQGLSKRFWSLFCTATVSIIFSGCEATGNTGNTGNTVNQPVGGGQAIEGSETGGSMAITGAAATGGNPVITPGVGDSGVGKTPGQPDAQIAVRPDAGVAGSGGSGGSPPMASVDSGVNPDGSSVTPPPEAGSGGGAPPIKVEPGELCLQSGDGSYGEPGPYRMVREDNIDLASLLPQGTPAPTTYSIWRPEPLEASCLHPIVAWGNGTTVEGPDVYDFFNRNAATWGMVVIGSNNSNVGSGAYHRAGIDYLLMQNEDPNSKFYHKLSTRAGTSGHSQGGMGATMASSHPNVIAEVSVAGGGMVDPKVAIICLTGTEDMAASMCTLSFNGAAGPAFLASWQGGDHVVTETLAGYITRDPGSLALQRLYAAWFRCFLADDQAACGMFKGNPCGMCSEPGWAELTGRNM